MVFEDDEKEPEALSEDALGEVLEEEPDDEDDDLALGLPEGGEEEGKEWA
jgi:hypothetical protein